MLDRNGLPSVLDYPMYGKEGYIMKKRKKNIFVVLLALLLVMIGACSKSNEETSSTTNTKNKEESKMNSSSSSNIGEVGEESESTTGSEESATDASNETSSEKKGNKESNNTSKSEKNNALSKYSSEEIEYARVWLQLGPNQDIDELDVKHIPAGTPLNPDDNTNVSYPEDVIQIYGSRIVDGIVTYSGNGDGTINVYNVPYRWYGGFSRPDNVSLDEIRKEMKDIIKNTKLVYVDLGDNEKIIKLINKMNIH